MNPLSRLSISLDLVAQGDCYFQNDLSITTDTCKKASPTEVYRAVCKVLLQEFTNTAFSHSREDYLLLSEKIKKLELHDICPAKAMRKKVILFIDIIARQRITQHEKLLLTGTSDAFESKFRLTTEYAELKCITKLAFEYCTTSYVDFGLTKLPDTLFPFNELKANNPKNTIEQYKLSVVQLRWSLDQELSDTTSTSPVIGSISSDPGIRNEVLIMHYEIELIYHLITLSYRTSMVFALLRDHPKLSELKHAFTSGKGRLIFFPKISGTSMEEISIQLKTMYGIKGLVDHGLCKRTLKPLIKTLLTYADSSGKPDTAECMIQLLLAADSMSEAFSHYVAIEKKVYSILKTIIPSQDHLPSCKRLAFLVKMEELLRKAFEFCLTDSGSAIYPAVEKEALFLLIHNTLLQIAKLTMERDNLILFEKRMSQLPKPPRSKLLKTQIRNKRQKIYGSYLRYRADIKEKKWEGYTPIFEISAELKAEKKGGVETALNALILTETKPVTKGKSFDKAHRKGKISRAVVVEQVERKIPVFPTDKLIPPIDTTEEQWELMVDEVSSYFTYHRRVLRWFSPKGSAHDPLLYDPKYSHKTYSVEQEAWIRFKHRFTPNVDKIIKERGIVCRDSEKLNELAARKNIQTHYQIFAEVELYIPHKQVSSKRGIFTFSLDEKNICIHRVLTFEEDEALYEEYMKKGHWEFDYPALPLETSTSERESEKIKFLREEVIVKEHVTIIYDKVNRAKITLAHISI